MKMTIYFLLLVARTVAHHSRCGESAITFDGRTGKRCGSLSASDQSCSEAVIRSRDYSVPREPQRYLVTSGDSGMDYAYVDDLATAHTTDALWHADYVHVNRNDSAFFHDADSLFVSFLFASLMVLR